MTPEKATNTREMIKDSEGSLWNGKHNGQSETTNQCVVLAMETLKI